MNTLNRASLLAAWHPVFPFTMKSLQINALQNDDSDEDLVSGNQATLSRIAGAGNYYASVQAQNLLNMVNGESYIPPVILPVESLQLISLPPGTGGGSSREQWAQLEAVPNPANSQITFKYHLPENREMGIIIITELNGRTVASIKILDNKGRISWDANALAEGVYLYSLIVDNKNWVTGRLVIIK